VASQAAVYVHAIAMLQEREAALAGERVYRPEDAALREEQAGLSRSLRLFRTRLQRTEAALSAVSPGR
jgi:hypothetical protein